MTEPIFLNFSNCNIILLNLKSFKVKRLYIYVENNWLVPWMGEFIRQGEGVY